MKKLITSLALALGFIGTGFAGSSFAPSAPSGKESKDFKRTTAPAEETCFKAGEWQVDTFAQYSVGEGPNQVGLFRDHAVGGGVGLNYFFSRNIGLGFDAAWVSAKEAPSATSPTTTEDARVIHNFSGSLIFRAPLDRSCLAPYLYVGGGFHVDGEQWASAHAGVGLEYRIKPNKFGLFVDGRWTYLGDRNGHDELNFFSVRAGFRVIY